MDATVNTELLKRRMKRLELTQAELAKELDMAQPTFNQKLNNVRLFDVEEAAKLARLLGIGKSEIGIYFFK